MGYHRVDHSKKSVEADRTLWTIVTFWSEHDEKFDRGHEGEAYTLLSDGHKVLRWTSNDHVVPDDIVEATRGLFNEPWPFIDEHKAARHAETSKFIAEYKERMKDHVPSAEEQFEMRAAFGPGQTVVNAITGKKYRT